jgi:hypothetical protein
MKAPGSVKLSGHLDGKLLLRHRKPDHTDDS